MRSAAVRKARHINDDNVLRARDADDDLDLPVAELGRGRTLHVLHCVPHQAGNVPQLAVDFINRHFSSTYIVGVAEVIADWAPGADGGIHVGDQVLGDVRDEERLPSALASNQHEHGDLQDRADIWVLESLVHVEVQLVAGQLSSWVVVVGIVGHFVLCEIE